MDHLISLDPWGPNSTIDSFGRKMFRFLQKWLGLPLNLSNKTLTRTTRPTWPTNWSSPSEAWIRSSRWAMQGRCCNTERQRTKRLHATWTKALARSIPAMSSGWECVMFEPNTQWPKITSLRICPSQSMRLRFNVKGFTFCRFIWIISSYLLIT